MEPHDWWLDYLSNPMVGRFRPGRGIQTDSRNSFQSSPGAFIDQGRFCAAFRGDNLLAGCIGSI
jgi:hypothetical protein